MKRFLLLFVLPFALVIGAWHFYSNCTRILWTGGFTQKVNVHAGQLRATKAFFFTMDAINEEYARELVKYAPEDRSPFRPVEDFDGQSFDFEVRTGGAADHNWNEITYHREKWLGIVIYLEGGKKARKLEAIPERGQDRPITVTVP